MVAEEITVASHDQRASPRDLGGGQSRAARQCQTKQNKLEAGAMVWIDSTVTAALMHQSSDSALLRDAVRVMSRLLRDKQDENTRT
jgi:hypothetical protein